MYFGTPQKPSVTIAALRAQDATITYSGLLPIRFIFHDQNPQRPSTQTTHASTFSSGNVKQNVEPAPGRDSTHILPPWRSTILLQMASPIPVPG
jgi:hypothetical protein